MAMLLWSIPIMLFMVAIAVVPIVVAARRDHDDELRARRERAAVRAVPGLARLLPRQRSRRRRRARGPD